MTNVWTPVADLRGEPGPPGAPGPQGPMPENEEWTPFNFNVNWRDYSNGTTEFGTCSYMKDMTGRVWLRGMAERIAFGAGAAESNAIVTLPGGYRPAQSLIFPTILQGGSTGGNAGRMTVYNDGRVVPFVLGGNTPAVWWITVSNISFFAG